MTAVSILAYNKSTSTIDSHNQNMVVLTTHTHLHHTLPDPFAGVQTPENSLEKFPAYA